MTVLETSTNLVASIDSAHGWLSGLDESVVRNKPSADRWSIAEVVGHLVDSACNNHQRFIRAQEADELSFPKYDQNSWVTGANYQQFDWTHLVQLWHSYNSLLAHTIANIPENLLETPCQITPYEECSLGFLVTDYLVHMNHHLEKIRERI